MVIRNARLVPSTEKGGLASPVWTDNEFKSLLGEHMDFIVTQSVGLNLTKKFGIHPEKVWSIEDCKKVLGASIRKNNVKAIICCHKEFSLSIAQEQAGCIAKLNEQNKQCRLNCPVSRQWWARTMPQPNVTLKTNSQMKLILTYKHSLKQM